MLDSVECIEKMRITLTQTDVMVEEFLYNGIVKSKFIRADDLIDCISFASRQDGIETGILPEGCIFYREEKDGMKYVAIKYINGIVDFVYNNAEFKNCPLPNMLFGFKVAMNGHIYTKMVSCFKGNKVRMDTKLCYYPFSNVYKNNHSICLGSNRLPMIDDIRQLESIPHYILSLPNNDDMFCLEHNSRGLSYRDLLAELQGKDEFDENLLVERPETVKDFIYTLKK